MTVLAILAAMAVLIIIFGVHHARLERRTYEAGLSPDDRTRLRRFCATGRTWQEFREIEEEKSTRPPGRCV
jgi:hypothetical protein